MAAENQPTQKLTELRAMVITYAKQETLDPLKQLKSYLLWGVLGGLLLSVGALAGLIALLRALQTLTIFNDVDRLHGGTWSWAPYLITIFVGAGIALLASLGISKKKSKTAGK